MVQETSCTIILYFKAQRAARVSSESPSKAYKKQALSARTTKTLPACTMNPTNARKGHRNCSAADPGQNGGGHVAPETLPAFTRNPTNAPEVLRGRSAANPVQNGCGHVARPNPCQPAQRPERQPGILRPCRLHENVPCPAEKPRVRPALAKAVHQLRRRGIPRDRSPPQTRGPGVAPRKLGGSWGKLGLQAFEESAEGGTRFRGGAAVMKGGLHVRNARRHARL